MDWQLQKPRFCFHVSCLLPEAKMHNLMSETGLKYLLKRKSEG